MAYERDDRGYSRGSTGSYGRDRSSARDRDYGRQPQGYSYDDRGFIDRAGDEVRSWFGDEEAERRRRMDERYDERNRTRDEGDEGRGRYGAGAGDRYGHGGGGSRSDYGRSSGERDYGASSYSADRSQSGRGYDRDRDDGRAYGQGSPSNYGVSGDRHRSHHDESYQSWRDRQMADYDRDYEDYRRENQSRFETEFTSWRTTRAGQRQRLSSVKEHQEVVGSDGQHVGTVDHVQGDRIKLAKNDKDAAGIHHFIPCSWVDSVDDKVKVNKTAAEAKQHWTDEARNSGQQMFGRDDDDRGAGGDRNLNKSFPGTY